MVDWSEGSCLSPNTAAEVSGDGRGGKAATNACHESERSEDDEVSERERKKFG
jgi:hypothetical protein